MLFTNRHEIRRIDLVKRDYSQVVSTQKNTVALDLDVANNRVFWCDRFHRKIYRLVEMGDAGSGWLPSWSLLFFMLDDLSSWMSVEAQINISFWEQTCLALT